MKVHSVIDLITNSSTEIFTTATDTAVLDVRVLLGEILKAAGSKKQVDDVFDIKVEVAEEPYNEDLSLGKQRQLIVTLKGQNKNLITDFRTLFDQTAYYNG